MLLEQDRGSVVPTGLTVLSAAESLTDRLALHLLSGVGIEQGVAIVGLLHCCDFVEERTADWRMAPSARRFLLDRLSESGALNRSLNSQLYDMVRQPGRLEGQLPVYLLDGPGLGYHGAELSPSTGLEHYSLLAESELLRVRWMSSVLADEQTQRLVLSPEAIELRFLRGMTLYKDGRQGQAVSELSPIAERDDVRREVAVSAHLVGRLETRNGETYQDGILLLQKSIQLGLLLGDERHVAHVRHTLGLALLQHDRKTNLSEAHQLLGSSLAYFNAADDGFGVAAVLHTLGQSLARSRKQSDLEQAEFLLMRSLELGRRLGYRRHQADVLLSLSDLFWNVDPVRRRALLDEAATIDSELVERHIKRKTNYERNKGPTRRKGRK